jgi:hypothetical protein
VPIEGHTQRLEASLSGRDRRFIVIITCVFVLGAAACVFAYASSPAAPSNEGCVVVTAASSLGGTTLRNCGAAAERFCRNEGKLNDEFAVACRREGYAVGPEKLNTG